MGGVLLDLSVLCSTVAPNPPSFFTSHRTHTLMTRSIPFMRCDARSYNIVSSVTGAPFKSFLLFLDTATDTFLFFYDYFGRRGVPLGPYKPLFTFLKPPALNVFPTKLNMETTATTVSKSLEK